MGKGDIKTRKGKIFKGTFGVTRPHKVKIAQPEKPVAKKKTAKKKTSK